MLWVQLNTAHDNVMLLFNFIMVFLIIALWIIYEYGMLSMGYDCGLENIFYKSIYVAH